MVFEHVAACKIIADAFISVQLNYLGKESPGFKFKIGKKRTDQIYFLKAKINLEETNFFGGVFTIVLKILLKCDWS